MKHLPNRPIYIKHKLSNVVNIGKIVTMHYYEFDKHFKVPGECHDFWEMVYVDSGNIIINAGKTRHTLRSGEIIFHKPNEFHTISSDGKVPSNVFVISFATTSKNMMYFKGKKAVVPKDLKPYIKTLISEGRNTFDLPFNDPALRELTLSKNPPFGGQQIIRTTLEQFLIMFIRKEEENKSNTHIFPDKESMDNHLVDSVIELLKKNIYSKITINEICASLNYSKTYISKIFNQSCGCTIVEYYTQLKIKEAKVLLRNNANSIAEISNLLCFNDPHYFTRVFKRSTNMSPREYLKSVSK